MRNRNLTFRYSFLMMLLCLSCAKTALREAGQRPAFEQKIAFTLPGEESSKALSPTAAEQQISLMHWFVFDSRGVLDCCGALSEAEIAAREFRIQMREGSISVWLVANVDFPESFLSGLTQEQELADYEYGFFAGGLPMVCHQELENPGTGLAEEPSLPLAFAVSRIELSSVKNALLWPLQNKSIRLCGAVLCNAVAKRRLLGAAPSRQWLNPEGTRAHRTNQLIGRTYPWYLAAGESEAEYISRKSYGDPGSALFDLAPEDPLLFDGDETALEMSRRYMKTLPPGETASLSEYGAFYAFPNADTEPNSGWHDSFVATATVLLVIADIDGHRYWYPVPLTHGLAENRSCLVDLTITGLGNDADHWFDRLERISLRSAIETADWDRIPPDINEII